MTTVVNVGRNWGAGYRLEIIGDKQVLANLAALRKELPKRFNKALREEGQSILRISKANAPVDTGALRKSGKVVSGKEQEQYVVAIGFGDESMNEKTNTPTLKYARYQHETNPTKGKYLENAFIQVQEGMINRMAQKLIGVQ